MRLVSTVSHNGAVYLFFEDGSVFDMVESANGQVHFKKIADLPQSGSNLWRDPPEPPVRK